MKLELNIMCNYCGNEDEEKLMQLDSDHMDDDSYVEYSCFNCCNRVKIKIESDK